jgi:5-bromo-4-chloroindolyl phosphate hydrolysis protein
MYNYIASFFTESASSRATSEPAETWQLSYKAIETALNNLDEKIADLDKLLGQPNTFEQIEQMNTSIGKDVGNIVQKIKCMRTMTVPDDQVTDRNKKLVETTTALRRLTSCNLHNLKKYDQVDRLYQFDQVEKVHMESVQSQMEEVKTLM